MADPELVRILREEGVEAWNAFESENRVKKRNWRADFSGTNLKGVSFAGARLAGAIFAESGLSGLDFRGAELSRAEFTGSVASHADFGNARLSNAKLDCNFNYANFRGASIHSTDFRGAMLTGANFAGATTSFAAFNSLDLSSTNGLAAIHHSAPSGVTTSTLLRSHGRIPDIFLKGCGLADWEILQAQLYNPDLSAAQVTDIQYEVFRLRTTGPIQINPIFLSYVHKDSGTVSKLYDTLEADGIRCWRDKNHLTAGPIEDQVDRAMRVNPTVVLVLSESSVESDWVRWEAENARKLEKEQPKGERRRVLCPIALDDAWKDCDWPERLRTQIKDRFVIPFHELGFDEGYARLKKGLPIYYSGKKPES